MILLFDVAAAEAPPELQPARSPWSVGLGLHTDRTGANVPRVGGGYALTPSLNLDAGVRVRVPWVSPMTDMDELVVLLAYQGTRTTFSMPATVSPFTAELGLDWGFLPRVVPGAFSGGPRLYAGAQLRMMSTSKVTAEWGDDGVEAVVSPATTSWVPAVCGAVGLDVWWSGRIGGRLRWLGALYVGPEPDYGEIDPRTGEPAALETIVLGDSSLGIDVLYAF